MTRILIAIVLALLAPRAHAEPAPEAPKPVPAERASPRATMRTFLDSAVAASKDKNALLLDAAASCLDLSALPAGTRATTGRDLAIKLKEVIDRIALVDYETIPDTPTGKPWSFHYEPALAAEIVIGPTAAGEWLFTAATVARLDDLYKYFEPLKKVEGVGGSGLEISPTLWLRSQFHPALHSKTFLLEHWQWLCLLILIVLGWIIARIARLLLHGPVQRLLDRKDLKVPRNLVWRLLQPTGFVATMLLWVIGLNWVGLPPGVLVAAMLVVKFFAALGLVRTAFRFIDIITWILKQRAEKTPERFDDLMVPFVDKTAKVVVVALGIVFIADVLGISPASLLAGLGIGGLAIALAAQDTVKNLFGSLTIILDRPFEIGDDIRIGSDIAGIVEEVGFRSTRIRTYENTLITVPNGNLISANVDNLGKRTFWRYRSLINLAYATPTDKVHAFCQGLRTLALEHPATRKEAIFAGLFELSSSSIDILFICHFDVRDFGANIKARHELLLDVVTLASRLGVDFAYPTRTVHMVTTPPNDPRPVRASSEFTEAEQFGEAEARAILKAHLPRQD